MTNCDDAGNGTPAPPRGAGVASQPEAFDYPPVDEPPFWGQGQMLVWQAADLCQSGRRTDLFRNYWRHGRPDNGAASTDEAGLERMFDRLTEEIITDGLVDARGYYGFFPVITENETMVVLDPDDFRTERATLRFPRVASNKNRSIADALRPEGDFIAVQIVTLGAKIDRRCQTYLEERNPDSRGLYLKGMAGFLTEELSGKVSTEISRSLFLSGGQGSRHGFGEPGMPPPEDRAILFDIMSVEDRLGIVLTDRFAMDPESSALAIYVRRSSADAR